MNAPRKPKNPKAADTPHSRKKPPESTGSLAKYLRSLVDSRTPVTVFLKSGEQLTGRIRYYDRNCFSMGLENGPNVLLRSSSVLYVRESS